MILPKFRIEFDPDWRGNGGQMNADHPEPLFGAMTITISLPPKKRGGAMEEVRHGCAFATSSPDSKDFAVAIGSLLEWAVKKTKKPV